MKTRVCVNPTCVSGLWRIWAKVFLSFLNRPGDFYLWYAFLCPCGFTNHRFGDNYRQLIRYVLLCVLPSRAVLSEHSAQRERKGFTHREAICAFTTLSQTSPEKHTHTHTCTTFIKRSGFCVNAVCDSVYKPKV